MIKIPPTQSLAAHNIGGQWKMIISLLSLVTGSLSELWWLLSMSNVDRMLELKTCTVLYSGTRCHVWAPLPCLCYTLYSTNYALYDCLAYITLKISIFGLPLWRSFHIFIFTCLILYIIRNNGNIQGCKRLLFYLKANVSFNPLFSRFQSLIKV